MKELTVEFIERFSLILQELKQPDGSFKPGKQYYTATYFLNKDNDIDEIVGDYDCLQLKNINNPKEIWQFNNVRIMLAPDARIDYNKYVLTHNGVKIV